MSDYPQITPRQAQVLAAIVKENCDTGSPVASQDLIEKGYFDVSAATLRNEMQALEKLGFIHQPHTSSGRVPTDMGFRYFVSQLMERVQLSIKEQDRLKREVLKLQTINVEVGRRLAKLLAEASEQASFTLLPGETSTVGLSNILNNPGLPKEDAREIAEFFDNIDSYAEQIIADYGDQTPKAVIGQEIQIGKSDYSMVVSGVSLPDGKRGVVGLLGPKSMKYQKNMGILEYITKLLGGGGSVVIVFLEIFNHVNI